MDRNPLPRLLEKFELRNVALLFLFAIFLTVTALAYSSERSPLASSETRFVEKSVSGLNVIPASCPSVPSNPDYPHNSCSGTCPNGLNIGQYPTCTCPSGQTQSGSQCICANGLDVSQYPSCTCPAGQVQYGSQCVPDNSVVVTGYPSGNPNQCIVGQAYTIATTYPGGGSAQVYYVIDWGDGSAQERSPASGYESATAVHTASHTYTSNGQKTVAVKSVTSTSSGAETGWTQYSFTCETNCVEQNYCGGADITGDGIGDTRYHRYQSGGQCVNDNLGQCEWGCLGGQCLPPSGTEVDIWVTPPLLRNGETTLVQWQAEGVTSCTVGEDNPEIADLWSGEEVGCSNESCVGSHQSSSIRQRTKYTLTCTGIDENTYIDTATVNIIPVWIED